jgi:hypothetical protein
MKTQEEIEKLANEWALSNSDVTMWTNSSLNKGYIKGYTQCQEDMTDKIKEAYEQGLSDGYACMPSTISPLNKQD